MKMALALLMIVVIVSVDGTLRGVEAQQFGLVHRYSHLEGSAANNEGKGVSPDYYETLRSHDRRRLAAVVDFSLGGNAGDIGLYYTKIYLGTPAREFYVQVDTGSDILWVDCEPCSSTASCPTGKSSLGFSFSTYDTSKSSTDTSLLCSSSECKTAVQPSNSVTAGCYSTSCGYDVVYGDGSTTEGYIVSDVLTYTEISSSNSTNVNGTATVYFGCGTNQTGNLLNSTVDGLMGFGQASISVPTQLADQSKVGRVFAHCLVGDSNPGGGTMVIGTPNVTGLSYTPITATAHYNVKLENIAVAGSNITTAATFDTTASGGGGVIMDSGTTYSYLVETAYIAFINAVNSNAPTTATQIQSLYCYYFSGNITTSFPEVQLYFDGGVMTLGPNNYLVQYQFSPNQSPWCITWQLSSGTGAYTIFGENVLRDQLIVYDNDANRIGWKAYDCTKSFAVSSTNSSSPVSVNPSPSSPSSGAQDLRTELSRHLLSLCLAFAVYCTLL